MTAPTETLDDRLEDFEHRHLELEGVSKLVHVAGVGAAVADRLRRASAAR